MRLIFRRRSSVITQIEQSIRMISEGLATYDTKLLEKEIQVLSRQLDMIRVVKWRLLKQYYSI